MLKGKRKRFADEYLVDLNATQAAIRAGYSEKTAKSQGQRLLTFVDVAEYIAARQKKIADKLEVTVERIVSEYARLAFSDTSRVMEWGPDGVRLRPSSELSEDDRRAVAEVSETTSETGGSLRLKMHDKKGALDSLAKHLGMFKEQLSLDLSTKSLRELLEQVPEAIEALKQSISENGESK